MTGAPAITALQFMGARLNRETFRTSRLLEFCSERELIAQTGHPVEDWPLVIIKELGDNGIVSAEEAGVAPQVAVMISRKSGEIVVEDNGPGIPTETVDSILDYTVRVSSREAYVSPTRGAQGNALKTIVAMPFVLDGAAGETVIEARGIAHRIRFMVDPIRQEPRISCDRASSSVKTGTRVTVRWPAKACHLLDDDDGRFLPICWDYVALNPHLALACELPDASINWPEPSAPDWEKWRPTDQIPPHWYSLERLQRLMAACINRDQRDGKHVRLLREFVRNFRGLTSSVKLAAVLDELGLSRARLDVFFVEDKVDHAGITRLLAAMQQHSKPVKPERLGLIGRDHFARLFAADGADPDQIKYSRELGHDGDLPFVVEAAFARIKDLSSTPLVSGINWSPAIGDPFRWSASAWSHYSLRSLMHDRHILAGIPALIGISVATPTVSFVDRGKSAAMLTRAVGKAVETAVKKVTKEWFEAWEAEQRRRRQHVRAVERHIEELEKEERARERRQRAATVGTGKLHAEIAVAAERNGVSITRLTVLSTRLDPYRRDTTDGHRDGRWFADQITPLPADKKIHLRGLFYRVVTPGDIRRPDGSLFINDLDCWKWLQDTAAKAARWLGYVPFERIIDNRNDPPLVISYAEMPRLGSVGLSVGRSAPIEHSEDDLLPRVASERPVARQPYRNILIGEKSSLGEVLEPIAEQVKGELLLPTGEMSDTMIAEMAARAAEDPRQAVVLYFSDFDPSGWQMPVSVSRKLQALRTLRHPQLRIAVHPVALTLDQVRGLNLPSTPLKETEKRASKWRERMGHEQTEIDALAALRPEELTRIALNALKPFFDFTLDERCVRATTHSSIAAHRKLAAHPALPALSEAIRTAHQEVKVAIKALEDAQSAALSRLQEGDDGIKDVPVAVPGVTLDATPPAPLFITDDDFVTATQKLIAHKALAPDEDEYGGAP